MDLPEKVSGRDRLARAGLAVVLGLLAIRSLRNGKRLRGVLAGAGALALGYDASNRTPDLTETLGAESVGQDEARLTCAECGEPIRPGQPRGPNEDHEIVHEACK